MKFESDKDWCQEFIDGMKNRMVTSQHKYGRVKDNRCEIDFVACLEDRLKKYKETGNGEWLMDVANFAMMECVMPIRSDAHFRATDSHEAPKLKKF